MIVAGSDVGLFAAERSAAPSTPMKTKTVTSMVFRNLLERNSIRHVLAAPEIRGKPVPFETEGDDHDEDRDQEPLAIVTIVMMPAPANAAQDGEMKRPDAEMGDGKS